MLWLVTPVGVFTHNVHTSGMQDFLRLGLSPEAASEIYARTNHLWLRREPIWCAISGLHKVLILRRYILERILCDKMYGGDELSRLARRSRSEQRSTLWVGPERVGALNELVSMS